VRARNKRLLLPSRQSIAGHRPEEAGGDMVAAASCRLSQVKVSARRSNLLCRTCRSCFETM